MGESVITDYGEEAVLDVAVGGQVVEEPHEYESGTSVYTLDRETTSDGIQTVTGTLSGSDHTFTEGTDYEEDGTTGIDWSVGGDNPDADTVFYVTYDRPTDIIDTVKIGTGTSSVDDGDTSMQSSEFSGSPDRIVPKDNGERQFQIIVTGGTEVPSGTDVSEFGLFDSTGGMVYHEVDDPITVSQGISQEFFITLDLDGLRLTD